MKTNSLKQYLARVLPDGIYVRLLFYKAYGYFPNLANPQIFDEKIQWYKLNYRNPLMSTLADKYEVRNYLVRHDFGSLLNRLYGAWNKVEDIDFDLLPQRFVLKATHSTNMNILCKDKSRLNWPQACRVMQGWLKTNHFLVGREWAYKHVTPRIICEEYLENKEFGELIDYKFYCYDGKPEVVWACSGRFSEQGVAYNAYDMNWNRIHVFKGKPCSSLSIEKPSNFQEMVSVARELSRDFPFIRVDLYSVENRVIFGELTFYPDSGVVPFTPDEFNVFFGDFFPLKKYPEAV